MIRGSTVLCLLALGCAGGEEAASDADDAVAKPAEGPAPAPMSVEGTAPEPGPPTEALRLIAEAYGAHLVRCPIGGAGTVKVVDGSPRDMADQLGPSLALYGGDGDRPWPPLYDVGYVESGWVTLLGDPGSTDIYVRSVEKTYHLEWPEAQAGEVVQCTAVEEVPKRVLKGKVAHEGVERSILIGCGYNDQLKQGGEFEGEVAVPCSIWLLGTEGTKVDPQLVDVGTEPAVLSFELVEDPLRGPTGGWVPAGIDRLREIAGSEMAKLEAQVELLEGLLEQHDAKSPVGRILGRWLLDRRALLGETRLAVKLFDDPATQARALEAMNPPPPREPEAPADPHGGAP